MSQPGRDSVRMNGMLWSRRVRSMGPVLRVGDDPARPLGSNAGEQVPVYLLGREFVGVVEDGLNRDAGALDQQGA